MRFVTSALLAIALTAPLSHAGPVGVVVESGKTVGHAVRDGALTFGRTTRDFFVHGHRQARRTWNENADRTRADAHRDAERVKAEARE